MTARYVTGDGTKPVCRRCERSGSSCVWQSMPSGFRHGSSARYDADFADDQVWVPIAQGEFVILSSVMNMVSYDTLRHGVLSL